MKRYKTADEMMIGIVNDIESDGARAFARERSYYEVPMWTGVLTNPRARVVHNEIRNMRTGYPAASVAWNLDERDDVDSICWWNEKGQAISDDGKTFRGANYGQRMSIFIDDALALIKSDPGTRRAWVPIWRGGDLSHSQDGKDIPCTIGFGLRLSEGKLNMQVVMRSNSAFFVFPYDLYLFSVYQELFANELGVELGQLCWSSLSMHYFDNEFEVIREACDWYYRRPNLYPAMDPISFTLAEARVVYPDAMDKFRMGYDLTSPADDPILVQMQTGAKEIHESR